MQEYLTPDVLNLLLVGVFVLLASLIAAASNAVKDNERIKKVMHAWSIVDDHIIDLIFFVASGDPNLDHLEDEAEELDIDPRMLWLINEAEQRAAHYLGFEPDLIEIQARAERIYQELKSNPDTII